MSIAIARSESPSVFGAFSIVFTILIICHTIQYAIIGSPHAVQSASLSIEDFRTFTTNTAVVQLGLALGLSAAFLLAGTALETRAPSWTDMLIWAGLVCFAWQLQEFCRRICFSRHLLQLAFFSDFLNYGMQGLGIVLLYFRGSLTIERAFLVMLATSTISFLVTYTACRSFFVSTSGDSVKGTSAILWRYGRWLLATELISWGSSNSFIFVTGWFRGTTASSAIRATQVLLGPLSLVFRFVEVSLTPRMVDQFRTLETHRVVKRVYVMLGLFAIPTLLATIMLAPYADRIMAFVYGQDYAAYGWLLIATAATFLIRLFYVFGTLVLRALDSTNTIFRNAAITGAFSLILGIPSIYLFGLAGAAVMMILQALLSAILIWRDARYVVELSFHSHLLFPEGRQP